MSSLEWRSPYISYIFVWFHSGIRILEPGDDSGRVATILLYVLPTRHMDCDRMARCWRHCMTKLCGYLGWHGEGDGRSRCYERHRSICAFYEEVQWRRSEVANDHSKRGIGLNVCKVQSCAQAVRYALVSKSSLALPLASID